MITMASKTGGAVFQYESFTKEEAQASVRRLFSAGGGESGLFPELNFFGDYEVVLSERLRMRGAFGNVAPVEMEDDVFMSSNVIGMGKTLKWRSACLSPTLSLTFFLDLITSVKLTTTKKYTYTHMNTYICIYIHY